MDMSHEIKLNKILREELKCHRCKSLPTLEGLERHRCAGYDNHAICKSCYKKNQNCPCGRTVNLSVCSITRKLFKTRKLPISCKFNNNGCQILHFDRQKLFDHENICSFSLKNRTFNLFKSEPDVQNQCEICLEIFDGGLEECIKCILQSHIKNDMENVHRDICTIEIENEGLLDTLQEHKQVHSQLQIEIENEKISNLVLEHLVQMKNHENSELKKEIEEMKLANVLLPMPLLPTSQKEHIVESDLDSETETYENAIYHLGEEFCNGLIPSLDLYLKKVRNLARQRGLKIVSPPLISLPI